MKLSIFSNFLNHHQKALADNFDSMENIEFHFISMNPLPKSFENTGYNIGEKKYEIKFYGNIEAKNKALGLIEDSDILIYGSVPDKLFRNRVKSNKLTFKYSERIFKKREYKFDPRRIYYNLKNFTFFRNKNYFLLCAGAFTANDYEIFGAFPNKKLKWGYFLNEKGSKQKEISEVKKIRLIFIARLIPWKRPDLVIDLADILNKRGVEFELMIVGVGTLLENLKNKVRTKGLNEKVFFLQNLSNYQVLNLLSNSDIVFLTSNREEGWGAVTNEAMNNNCAIIISNEIGCAPFLIKNYETGLVFKSGDLESLKQKTLTMIENNSLRDKVQKNAYKYINNEWSAAIAANRFIQFCETKDINLFTDGPCSEATPTKLNWYK